MNGITGVTMRSGTRVPFSVPGGQITNDTLYGVGPRGQLPLPVDSVESVWKTGRSTRRTIGVSFGLLAVAVAAFAFAYFTTPFYGNP